MLENKTFQFKGSLFTLTVMQLFANDISSLEQQLEAHINKAPNFFRNAPIIIDLQFINNKEENDVIDFYMLKNTLHKYNLIPVAVRGGKDSDHQAAASCGFAILTNYKSNEINNDINNEKSDEKPSNDAISVKSDAQSSTMVVTSPIRSGQQVYAKEGDLIVLSQVSPGAEILADGNIHIYGSLRGRVLAGIHGNQQAKIFCNDMDAELVSIAGFYLVAENLKQYTQKYQQMVYLENSELKISRL